MLKITNSFSSHNTTGIISPSASTITTAFIIITSITIAISISRRSSRAEYEYPFKFEPRAPPSTICPSCQSRKCKFERCQIIGKVTNFSFILPDRKSTFELISFIDVSIEWLDYSFFGGLKIGRLVFLDCEIENAIVWDLFRGVKKLDELFLTDSKNLATLVWNHQFMRPLFDKLKGLKITVPPRTGVDQSFLRNFKELVKVIIIGPMKDIQFLSHVPKLTFLYLSNINVTETNFLNFKNVRNTLEYLILNSTQNLTLNEPSFNKLTKLKYLEVIGEAKVYLNFRQILKEIEFVGSAMIVDNLKALGMITSDKTIAPSKTSDHSLIRGSARLNRSSYVLLLLLTVNWNWACYIFN